MKFTPKTLVTYALVEAVVLLSLIALFFWSHQETRPLAWDQSIHTKIAWTYQDRLSGKSDAALFAPVDMNYPPLFHLSLMAALQVVRDPAHAGALVNAVWMIILVFCVFGIGRKLMGAWEGAIAAGMVMCYPLVIEMMRDTMIDFSLMGWVALAVLCLVMSESFSRPAWAIGFGVSLAGGLLTKWTALAYIAGPFLSVAWSAFQRRETRWLWISLAVSAILLAPWYVPNLLPMLSRLPRLSKLPPASGQRLSGLANTFWYPISLFEQMTLVFVIALAVGVLVAFRRKALWPVLAWFLVSMILFSLIRNRNVRYFMPALPAAALLAAAWMGACPRWAKAAAALVVLAFSAATQFGIGHRVGFAAGPEFIDVYSPRPGISENWQHRDIIGYFNTVTPSVPNRPVRVLVLANGPYFHSTTLTMSARQFGQSAAVFYGPSKRRSFEFADYVLTKTGDLGPAFTLGTINECVNLTKDPNSWFPHVYKEVKRWPLADQSEAVLYAAKPERQDIADAGLFNLNLKQMVLPNIEANDVRMKAVPLSPRDTQEGRLKEFVLQCGTVHYKNVTFNDVTIRLLRPQINLPLYFETQSIELLSLDTLQVNATFRSTALLALAAKKARWLKDPQLTFDRDRIQVAGSASGIPLRVEARVEATEAVLKTRVDRVSIAGIRVPLILLRSLTDQTVDLNANRDLAYNLRLAPIQGDGDTLRIGQ